ncbi:hypothetical protein [Galbibacter pacificus]|uniref:HTH luxR-type domain-containing protein n=1 Tax=Galbibacter pacificus TaxID=2996052 RepID=A0ABT6FNW6_9FLAO|nr:hypothetical protein [Galbibacter pacificus]MDG3581379.1 hypothetical protein [Galbibacter pacificus]MDG3584857.1 hypothetical protein [Galbibacter pacificus]
MSRFYLFLLLISYVSPINAQQSIQLEPILKNRSSADRIRNINRYIIKKIEETDGNDNKQKELETILKIATSLAYKYKDEPFLKELNFIKLTPFTFIETDSRNRIQGYEKVLENDKFKENSLYRAICLHQIGQNQFVLERYGWAFENSLNAQKIFKKIGYENVPNIGKYLHDLALDYYYFRNYKKAIEAMKTSITLPKFNNNLDIQRYNTLGMSYLKINKLDSAKFYLNMAYKRAEIYHDSVWMGISSGNIGEVYLLEGNKEKSVMYFRKNYNLNRNTYQHIEISREACSDLAKGYLATDSLEKAYNYITLTENYFNKNNSFEFGEQQQYEVAKKDYYHNFYQYYNKTKDYQKALLYRDSLQEVEKIINSKYKTALVKMSQDKLLIQENQAKLNLQKEEQAKLRLRSGIYILIVSLLAAFGFLLYYITNTRRKKERQISLQKHKIKELAYQNTQNELSLAVNKLNNLTEKVKEKNELIQQLQQKDKGRQDMQLLNELKSSIILTDENWKEYQEIFEQVYPNFIHRLKQQTPQLSPAELRCLCLEKLQLFNKEMAAVLGVSANTVMVTKHRIRKKLQLKTQDELQQWVMAL